MYFMGKTRKRNRLRGGNPELDVIKTEFATATVTNNTLLSAHTYVIPCKYAKDTKITVAEDYIYVDNIAACPLQYNGTVIVEKIKRIAKRLNKQYIELYDDSGIETSEYSYSLAHFQILLTGQSWYNHHEFLSDDHYENVEDNETVRNMTLREFIHESGYNLDDFIEGFTDLIQNVEDTPMYEILQYVNSHRKTAPMLVSELINASERLIHYNRQLKYTLE